LLLLFARIDVVLAHEFQFAVVADKNMLMAAGTIVTSLPSRTGIGQTDAVRRIFPSWSIPKVRR
jgi:hypothetical protein